MTCWYTINCIYCKSQEALERISLQKLYADWTAATQLPLIYSLLPSMLFNWSFLEFMPCEILGVHKEVNIVGQEAPWRSCFCRMIFVMWVLKHSPYAWPLCASIQCLTRRPKKASGVVVLFSFSPPHLHPNFFFFIPPFLRLRAWIPCAACLHLPSAESTGVCPSPAGSETLNIYHFPSDIYFLYI